MAKGKVLGCVSIVCMLSVGGTKAESSTSSVFVDASTSAKTTLMWMTDNNWSPVGAPTTGGQVEFLDLPMIGHKINGQRVQTATDNNSTRVNVDIESVSGDARHIIRHSSGHKNETQAADHYFTVANPNSFLGHWESGGNRAFFSLPGTWDVGFVPILWGLRANMRPMLDIPSGSKAIVANLDGKGMIDAVGTGELEISASAAAEGGVIQGGGKLTLRGEYEGELDELLAQSVFHLDASDSNSLVLSNDNVNGVSWIMRWNDVRAQNTEHYVYGEFFNFATAAHLISDAKPAFISKKDAPTGLRLVSFGSNCFHYDPVNMGPTNCILRFNTALVDVREVFFVAETPYGANYDVGILGVNSESYYMWDPSDQLFSYGADSQGQRAIANGEVCVNGEYKPLEDIVASRQTDLFTVSIGLSNTANVNMLGSSRGYKHMTGGSRIGEMLFFTNVLTRSQRTVINNYLNAKWRTGSTAQLGAVVARAASASIEVPEGRRAVVQDVVTANGGQLVKSGAGTLVVGTLASTGDVKVRVSDGAIAFEKTIAAPSVAAPAPDAWLWLDANAVGCYEETASEYFPDTTFITKWYDCRSEMRTTSFAKCFDDQFVPGTKDITANVARLATLKTWNGKKVLDFGMQWDSTLKNRASMQYPNWNVSVADTYAAFAVVRPLNNTAWHPIFGSKQYTYGVLRGTRSLANVTGASGNIVSARWAIDGVRCDPTVEHACFSQTDAFFVISLSANEAFFHNSLLQDRTPAGDTFAYSGYSGQFQVAETISYHRPLTEKEVRDTEAYLMNKWLGKNHPASVPIRISKLSFADGVTPNIEVGAGVSVEVCEVESSTGALTKTGSGSLKIVAPPDLATCGDLAVNGTYTIDCSGEMESDKIAFMRFDPNVAAKLQTQELDEPGGAKRIEMLSMNEADGRVVWDYNANRSLSLSTAGCRTPGVEDGRSSLTNPTLQTVAFPVGDMKVVDFGPHGGYYKADQNPLSSSAVLKLPWSGQQGFSVRDAFIIWRDTHDDGYSGNGTVFFGNDTWKTSFYSRGSNWAICSSSSGDTANVANGYISLDGVQVPYSTSVPEGFHLLSFSPTNETRFVTIANQNAGLNSMGGCSVGEIMIFTNKLALARHKYVAAKLMKKWFGKNMMTNVVDVGSISFVNGGVFQVAKNVEAAGTAVNCASLAGNGSIAADLVGGIASLSVAFESPRMCERISVEGSAMFKDDVSVTLTIPANVRPLSGEYVLFTAQALENLDLSRWTLTVVNPRNREYQLKRVGPEIHVDVSCPGMRILLK